MSDKPKKEKKEKKPKKEKLPKPSSKKLKICPNCKEEIPKKAKTCPHCAAKQKGNHLLLVILPMVLALLAGAAASVLVFHFPVALEELPFEVPFLSGPKISETVLGQGMELTEKQEKAVVAVLEQCGFQEISRVSPYAADAATTSYAVQDVNTERFMTAGDPIVVQVDNESKTVQSIMYRDNVIYANEEAASQVTDYYMDMAERDVYMEAVLEEVKSRVDLPELAVFPSRNHWNFYEEGNVLTVESTVTTKDGSGAETVRPFRARFEDGSLVSLTFPEEE